MAFHIGNGLLKFFYTGNLIQKLRPVLLLLTLGASGPVPFVAGFSVAGAAHIFFKLFDLKFLKYVQNSLS